jgi:hypothetical protein
MNKAKTATAVNYILSGVLWLLALLTLVLNICGAWALWHLAGFAFFLYIPVSSLSQIITIVRCYDIEDKKALWKNVLSLLISIVVILFTVFVSSTWFY